MPKKENPKMSKVAASLMCGDMLKIGEELSRLEAAGCDLLHLDVMDGIFVDNMALGPEWIGSIRKATTIPLDIHLATITPEKYIDMFSFTKPEFLTFHVETAENIPAVIKKIRELDIKPSIALNPETPIEEIIPYLELVDMVVVMTVHTGFAGQEFITETIEKIQQMKKLVSELDRPPLIEVDGNIKAETISWMKGALPDVYVLGTSALFHHRDEKDYVQRISSIREHIDELSQEK